MRITAVTAVPFVLPYRRPFHMASGTVLEAAHVLIRIETDEGPMGVAEAVSRSMIYGESQASIVEAVRSWFAPALAGLDPFEVESAQKVLRSVVANDTTKGAIDIALHDLRGKAVGESTWRLLGAASTSLRVTHMLGTGSVADVVAEAAAARQDSGIDAFKVKVDTRMSSSLALLAALRRELGDDALLYIDANQSLSAEETVASLGRLAELGVHLVEEPVPSTDLVGKARIAAAGGVAIMADESATTLETAAVQLTTGSARALSIKPARTGYTTSSRILGLARGLHARAIIGSQGDSAIGTITSATFGAAFEWTAREPAELDYFLGLGDQIVTSAPVIRAGRVHVDPTVAGNGVEIDEDKLAHFRVDS
ncbi:muconate cycloisomerase [Pseudolysinimonas kribbensis]|uniref:Muconate cycloisomerase n=1 Tax=Pseudolysinimonas kribbensis TaxID=433641 RepID=A0ABQ6K210_9MICO|nr:muconate cycloisomerase [Pseudolysinimonas kribbensis]